MRTHTSFGFNSLLRVTVCVCVCTPQTEPAAPNATSLKRLMTFPVTHHHKLRVQLTLQRTYNTSQLQHMPTACVAYAHLRQ